MKHLKFYIQHALRDMMRNGRRTVFALFCIAAGVAAIVALRSLALMIGDSLVYNIAGSYHGDIWAEALNGTEYTTSDNRKAISPEVVKQVQAWAKKNNVEMTTAITDLNLQIAPAGDNAQTVAGRPQFVGSVLIDPKVYPFYGPVLAIDPPGVPISQLFTGGNDVVISENLATNNKIKVGDQVHVSRTTELFTVRGIVSTDAESSLTSGSNAGPLTLFFGFAYFDQAKATLFQTENLPDEIYLKIPPGTTVEVMDTSLRATVPAMRTFNTTQALRNNQMFSSAIDRLVLLMGLAALLIGATGIIHTMLVVVGRRTTEIAVLKTLGVKGGQITTMFLIEAILMGVVGSVIGIGLGVLFSLGARTFMQGVWPKTLVWQVYPQAMVTGVLLGVLITAVFGFLPTLTAGAVRPALVLRPNETKLPALGCFQTFVVLIGVVIVIAFIIAGIIGNIGFHIGPIPVGGFILALIGLVMLCSMLAVIVGMLYLIVALIGKLPSFGSTDLRLALRGISTRRARTASTLLSLIVGIFSLSIITLVASSVPRLFNVQAQGFLGGNVVVIEPLSSIGLNLTHGLVVAQLKDKPGVETYQQVGLYNGRVVAVNGETNYAANVNLGIGETKANAAGIKGASRDQLIEDAFGPIITSDVTVSGYKPITVMEGRPLGPEDAGQLNVILGSTTLTQQVGFKVGDTITFRFQGKNTADTVYHIVGITAPVQPGSGTPASLASFGFTAPSGSIPSGIAPIASFTVAKVDEAHLNQTLINLSAIPLVYAIDVGFFESLLQRLISEFTAIPTVVAVLSLFSGAVIIANTVSLTTLERRRQVGVMKAIGLKGWRVLWQMVLENGIVGLLGGLLGVGIGVLGTLILASNSPTPILQAIDWGDVGLLLGLSLLISLIATLLSAWTAATEKPLNVLRYE